MATSESVEIPEHMTAEKTLDILKTQLKDKEVAMQETLKRAASEGITDSWKSLKAGALIQILFSYLKHVDFSIMQLIEAHEISVEIFVDAMDKFRQEDAQYRKQTYVLYAEHAENGCLSELQYSEEKPLVALMERHAARRSDGQMPRSSAPTHERPPPRPHEAGARYQDTIPENGGDDAVRRREILLMLLAQIMEFVSRRELSARMTTTGSRSVDSGSLFAVVLRVCEQRMQQLQKEDEQIRSTREMMSPRMIVADAMVQELLVSLVEMRMSEKEALVLDEVDTVERMRQLHVELKQEERQARTRVYAATGDDQQLNELQEMLRADFLQEVAHFSKSTRALGESMHNDASLQFAWETIQEQKKEIVRLRAANQELKRSQHSSSLGASGFTSSFVSESPTKAINLLRSQLSTHHDNNLHILQDHIIRLERALQQATTTNGHSSRHDASNATFDSSRGEGKENWMPRTGAQDFSQSLRHQRCSCDHCRRNATSLLSLQSEVKQLRAQVASDEDVLVRAEQGHSYLKRENAALTSTVLSAKQQQEELRQMVSDLTHDKQQVQTSLDSQRRMTERKLNMLKGQLNGTQERLRESEKQCCQLETDLTIKTSDLQSMEQRCNRLQNTCDTLSQTGTKLRESVARLECDLYSSESNLREKAELLQELKIRLQSYEKDRVLNQESNLTVDGVQERDTQIEQMKTNLRSLQIRIEDADKAKSTLAEDNNRLQLQLYKGEKQLSQQKQQIEGLKQETRLHDSLQKAGFETSRFKQQELERVRSELETLKCEYESAKHEFKRLAKITNTEQSKVNTLQKSLQTQLQENEVLQEQLSDICSRYMDAQAQLRNVIHSNRGKTSIDADASAQQTYKLRQEISDSKTTILMWMSKFNVVEEEKKRLEQNSIGMSEDNYSLQRQLEEVQAKCNQLQRKETDQSKLLAKERADLITKANDDVVKARQQAHETYEAKLLRVSEDNTSLRHEVKSLKDGLTKHDEHAAIREQTQHTLESWKQEIEATNKRNSGLQQEVQDKAREIEMLSILVHTLESRPKLQGRIFQDLLASSERQFEQVLSKMSGALQITSRKLSYVENMWKLASERNQKRRMIKPAQLQRKRVGMDANDFSLERETKQSIMISKDAQEMTTRYDHICLMIKGLAASIKSETFQELIRADQFKNPVDLTRAVFAQVSTVVHSAQVSSAYEVMPLKSIQPAKLSVNSKENSVRRESPLLSKFIPAVSSNISSSHQKHDLREQIIYQRWHFLITVCAMIQRIRGKYQACKYAVANVRSICKTQRITSRWNRLVNMCMGNAQNKAHRKLQNSLMCIWKQQNLESRCCWKWQRMSLCIQQTQGAKFTRLLLLRMLAMNHKNQQLQLSYSFKLWRHHAHSKYHEDKNLAFKKKILTTSPTAVALGKCVALLRQFCEEDSTANYQNAAASQPGTAELFQDTELLGKYLIESTKKIAHWKLLLNRNTDELTERKEQMERLRTQCTELRELLKMNQRLVSEMERNAAGRRSILEAVSRFATAFKGLGSPVNAHLMKTQTFVDACQAIVNVAHTFQLSTAQDILEESKLQSSTHGTQSCKKVWFRSASEVSIDSMHEERQALTDSNIELLESVVGSLRNVNASRIALQNSLRTQSNTLQVVKTQLSSRTTQLMVLRAFLRWKSKIRKLRRQSDQHRSACVVK